MSLLNTSFEDERLTTRCRADLEFALNLGCLTRFRLQDVPDSLILKLLSGAEVPHFQLRTWPVFIQLSPDLQQALMLGFRLSSLINNSATKNTNIDGNIFHDSVIMIGYQLVHICPLATLPLPDEFANILFLGLCAFLVTFLTGLDRRMPHIPLLSMGLRQAVQSCQQASYEWHQLQLWALFIGRTTVLSQMDDSWVLPKMCESIHRLGLSDLPQLRLSLSNFPWINMLHDRICERLYMRITNDLQRQPLLSLRCNHIPI